MPRTVFPSSSFSQVAEKIRRHECVSVIERTNLRYLTELPQKVDIVTLDLSFISILTVSYWMWVIVFVCFQLIIHFPHSRKKTPFSLIFLF